MGKASIRRRVTRKRVNRKNKKTRRKGVNQTGGRRRRPNGPGTAGAASGNNGLMNEGGPDYLNAVEKAEAIALIRANNQEELLALLDSRTFPDDDALIAAVTMPGANIEMISEVISKTPINSDTEVKISDAIHENSALLTEVLEILHAEEARQEEARRLEEQEKKYANTGGVSTPLPRTMNEED